MYIPQDTMLTHQSVELSGKLTEATMSFDAEGEKLSCSTISADLDASTSLPFFLVLYNSFLPCFMLFFYPQSQLSLLRCRTTRTQTRTTAGRSLARRSFTGSAARYEVQGDVIGIDLGTTNSCVSIMEVCERFWNTENAFC